MASIPVAYRSESQLSIEDKEEILLKLFPELDNSQIDAVLDRAASLRTAANIGCAYMYNESVEKFAGLSSNRFFLKLFPKAKGDDLKKVPQSDFAVQLQYLQERAPSASSGSLAASTLLTPPTVATSIPPAQATAVGEVDMPIRVEATANQTAARGAESTERVLQLQQEIAQLNHMNVKLQSSLEEVSAQLQASGSARSESERHRDALEARCRGLEQQLSAQAPRQNEMDSQRYEQIRVEVRHEVEADLRTKMEGENRAHVQQLEAEIAKQKDSLDAINAAYKSTEKLRTAAEQSLKAARENLDTLKAKENECRWQANEAMEWKARFEQEQREHRENIEEWTKNFGDQRRAQAEMEHSNKEMIQKLTQEIQTVKNARAEQLVAEAQQLAIANEARARQAEELKKQIEEHQARNRYYEEQERQRLLAEQAQQAEMRRQQEENQRRAEEARRRAQEMQASEDRVRNMVMALQQRTKWAIIEAASERERAPKPCIRCGVVTENSKLFSYAHGCGHKICEGCWVENIAAQINDMYSPAGAPYEEFKITCAARGCAARFDDDMIPFVVKGEPHTKMLNSVRERATLKMMSNASRIPPNTACQICLIEEDIADGYALIDCGHWAHKECLMNSFRNTIEQNSCDFKCPSAGLGCTGTCARDLPYFLNPVEMDKVTKIRLRTDNAAFGSCPGVDCGYVFEQTPGVIRFDCPVCEQKGGTKKIYCLACRVLYHDGKTCEQYKAEIVNATDEFLAKMTKPCPNCKVPTYKDESGEQGCRHMICTQCKPPCNWCFICSQVYAMPGLRIRHAPDCDEKWNTLREEYLQNNPQAAAKAAARAEADKTGAPIPGAAGAH